MPLNLAYDSTVPRGVLLAMERAGRRIGLPLATMERLGQSEDACRAFLSALEQGDRARLAVLTDGLTGPPLPVHHAPQRALV